MKKLFLIFLSMSFFSVPYTMPMSSESSQSSSSSQLPPMPSMEDLTNMLGSFMPTSDTMNGMAKTAAKAFADGLGDGLGKGLSKGLSEGLSDGFGNTTDVLFERLNNNMSNGGNGSEAIKKFFDNVFQHMSNNFANGGNAQQGTSNFFAMFADQFKAGGNGSRVFEEFFTSLGRLFQNGGAANGANENIRDFINAQFVAGGIFEEVKRSAGSFIGRSVDEAAKGLNDMAQHELGADSNLSRAWEKGTGFFQKNMQRELQQGGNIEKLSTEVHGFVKNVSTQYTHLLGENMIKIGIFSGLSALISMSGYYGSKVLWKWIETELFRPKLLIAYDSRGAWSAARDFIHKPKPVTMIFTQQLEADLINIVAATRSIYKKIMGGSKNVKYRNLLLWGPPGTGKTMFAKRLAQESGLAWAHMSGSSFSKFKDGEGIQALDDLMAWANKKNGLLIFIDEAESLIAKREKMDPNSKAYQLLTNFLNYTGERSDKFMLVMATNHKDVIDSAMHRRIDDLVYVPLPEREERMQVLGLYRDKILLDATQNNAQFVASVREVMTDTTIARIADKTMGLSNGDLEGIINIIKTDADITDSGLVTHVIVEHAVQQGINKHAEFCRSRTTAMGV